MRILNKNSHTFCVAILERTGRFELPKMLVLQTSALTRLGYVRKQRMRDSNECKIASEARILTLVFFHISKWAF